VQADLSRWTFRPERHYSRVVVQQGRVSLDADANAQASIVLHYLRALAADLIGEFGGPSDNLGFVILPVGTQDPTFTIGLGHYYVDGLLCEAGGQAPIDYYQQPDGYRQPDGYGAVPPLQDPPYLVWLKVWERFISAAEDPDLREIALGPNGPDTAGRTKIVWQVLTSPWPQDVQFPENAQEFYNPNDQNPNGLWSKVQQDLGFEPPTGRLMAQAIAPQLSTDACTLSPASGYRGVENQLYRVEIHRDGTATATPPGTAPPPGGPTFTWSRDNGSVILPITSINGNIVSVTTLGRDPKLSVDVGNYVEIVDDAYASQGLPGPSPRPAEPLHLVTAVDPVNLTVTLDQAPAPGIKVGQYPALHPYLRRWDQDQVLVTKAGLTIDTLDQAIDIVTTDAGQWIDLEDGVQVQFSAGSYRAGDYWLIPARVVTGDVEWPADADGNPLPLPPEGVRYHVAPLAIVTSLAGSPTNLRLPFTPLNGFSLVATDTPEGSPAPAARSSRATRKTTR